jgi:multifunctional beta-oxidation protein
MAQLLDGKVAIVTGAGRGIGRACAELLASLGARVVVNDLGSAVDGSGRSSGPAEETVAAIRAAGGTAVASADSVVEMAAGERLVKTALDSFGRLDIVVTPAGILRDRMIFNMSEQEWDDVIAVHLKGTFTVVKHAAIVFRQQRSGRVITFSSESGLIGFAGQANYGAAKSGIAGLTKVVARDLGRYGATANCIAPRAMTRMIATIPEAAKQSLAAAGADFAGQSGSLDPADIAPMVGYLASDYAANVNGQIFLVHGGTVGLMSQPRPVRSIFKPSGRWTQDELAKLVPVRLLDGKEQAPAGKATRLDGKVAVITGAGRGIGRGIALLLAAQGARVVVNDIGAALDGSGSDARPAQQVADEIKAAGGHAVASYDSVASGAGGEKVVQAAVDAFGRLDIVVTPAGILRDRMVFNMTEQEWDDVIAVHLKGTFSIVRPASIIFRQQKGGRIITFTSVSGLYGYSGQSNYGAAKDGIAGFTRVVAKDMAKYGVTVNSISPGANTRMTASVPDAVRQMRRGSALPPPEGILTRDADDVAPMVAWLASDSAAGVTGRIFHCVGNTVGLMGEPVVTRSIHKDGRWTIDELAALFPGTLGIDLVNPAPMQSPKDMQASAAARGA